MSWFRNWFGTRYYTLLYGHRDVDDAQSWADAILERWGLAPGSVVLDLACGRGRHARWFAQRGMSVVGVDISPTSIAEAKAAIPGVEFRVHDMRVPVATDRFNGIYCLFTSLGYSDSLDDDRKVFAGVVQALQPGGRFVLDFMNTPVVLRDLVPQEEVELENITFRIERYVEEHVLVKHVTVVDGSDVHHFEERVQALMPEQIERMAIDAGLVIEDRTDGPILTTFDEQRSQRFVLWARKPSVA